ncbi:MAG: hypothetical protein M1377_05830 [Deltaproteobacteria bacterium]|nr:hypothetical protein [Deltaproteobacteria bacterium]
MGRRGRGKIIRPQKPEKKNNHNSLFKVWNMVVVVGVLVGLYVAHLTLKPRISIEPDVKKISINPFTSSFRIKNDGYLSVKNIHIDYKIRNVDIRYHRVFENIGVTYNKIDIKELTPNQTETAFRIVYPIALPESPTGADIVIVISYEDYWPPPWKETKKYSFALTTASDGSQHWQHANTTRE